MLIQMLKRRIIEYICLTHDRDRRIFVLRNIIDFCENLLEMAQDEEFFEDLQRKIEKLKK